MSKRKKAPPKRVDQEKRNRLTWNMGDGDRSLQIIDDEDPSLIFEGQNASDVHRWDNDSLHLSAHSSNAHDNPLPPLARSSKSDVPASKHVAKNTPLACVEETISETVINIDDDTQDQASLTVLKPKKVYENYLVAEGDERLKQSLQNCHAMVEVHSTASANSSNWQCEVGSFKISVLQPNDVESRIGQCISVPDVEKFWLYGSAIPGCSILYYEFSACQDQANIGFVWKKKNPFLNRMMPVNQRKVLYYLANIELPFEILAIMHRTPKQKRFRFVSRGYSEESGEVEVAVYLQETGLVSVQHPSELPSKTMGRALPDVYKLTQAIMSFFQGLAPPDSDFTGKRFSRKHDIKDFFRNIKEIHDKIPPELRLDVQHPTLKPVLRPYQKQGVLWMLQNERYKDEEKAEDCRNEAVVHQLYEEVTMKDGQRLYYNKFGGIFVKERPKAIINPPGGLLADEMGLGKTVEVLACMLLNPRKDLTEHESPHAVKTWVKDRVKSPKKEVTAKAEDTSRTDPLDIATADEPPQTTSQEMSPIPVKVPVLNDATPSESSLHPWDESVSSEVGKDRNLSVSASDEDVYKNSSSDKVDVVKKQTADVGELSKHTVEVQAVEVPVDKSSMITSGVRVPSPSVIQLGPTTDFSCIGGGSIPRADTSVTKSREGDSACTTSKGPVAPIRDEDLTKETLANQEYLKAQYELSMARLGKSSGFNASPTNISTQDPKVNFVTSGPASSFMGFTGGTGIMKTSVNVLRSEKDDPTASSLQSKAPVQHIKDQSLTIETIADREHLKAQYDLYTGRLGKSSLFNASHSNDSSQDPKVNLSTSDESSSCEIVASDKAKGMKTQSPQIEKPVKAASGDKLDELEHKVDNDYTIPFGDSMAEYDLGVLEDGMSESSRWDFWLKRKQVVLERPKTLTESDKVDIVLEKPVVDAQQSIDSTRGFDSRICDIPGDSVAIDSCVSPHLHGMNSSVIEQIDSKLTTLESSARDLKQGSNMSSGLSGETDPNRSEKSEVAQTELVQGVQGLNSSLGAGDMCVVENSPVKTGKKKKKNRKKKKSRSKSVMSHVLVATNNNTESKTERHKTADGLDLACDDLKTECDKSVICSEVENGASKVTETEAGVVNGKKGKRKLQGGTKTGTPKTTKFEYNVPVDKFPSPKKRFSQKAEQKEFFECVCGQKAVDFDTKLRVQCDKCGLWQHADCVGYDVEDPCRGDYKCPHCHVISPPVPSGATLIISPNAICHQWVEEIHKHIKEEKLKLFVYGGVHKHRFIQPQTLANHDIVITTYETLSKEINYVDLPHSNSEKGRRLRHPKRFMAIPSPIVAVEWWRICLDEAQMVECPTTKTAEMALRLSAVNRWCVTGTPIHHDLADLYGLLLFLGVDPYWVKLWWDLILYNPYCYGLKEPMHQAIAKVLWRTSKFDVIDQLGLPTQSEKIHWLKFSPIEEHFYRQQYEHHYKQATNMLKKWSDNRKKLSSLDRHTLHWLLNPLVNLRQACCHPQAVRGGFLSVHKTTMTMEEILTQLTKKSKTECEESHRQMVAAMNGMAALHIIKEEYVAAVEVYRDVLRAVVEHENKIRTDKIQQLHTLHNLDEILSLAIDGVGRTLRDDQLKQQCKEIKEEYLAKAVANVVVAHEALESVQENIQDLSAKLEGGVNWWVDVIEYALAAGLDDVLIGRVRSELQDTSSLGRDSLANKFRNVNGMEYVLNILLEQLEEAHDNLTVSLTELDEEPTPNSVEEAVVCCLRPAGEVRKTCCFCKADELFSVYESKLFLFKEQKVFAGIQEDGQYSVTTKRQGTWADSELEKAIKILASFTRHIAADAGLSEYGSIHIKIFDALKKEFKCLRNKWLYLRERVSAIDELNMATTRYRLRLPGEELSDPPQPNVLDPVEVDVNKSRLSADKMIAESELRKKLGQLIYLRNLEKAHDHLEGGSNPETCPICQKELGDEWSVMRCGHFFCMDCIHIMLNDYSFGLRRKSLKCAICRHISLHSEISYVSLKKTSNTEEGDKCVQVKGDHSTKVTAVVRCLKQIQLNDPGAKALVFSTWQEVLNVIAQGLRQNNIGFKSLHAQNKFQANLHSFRNDDDVSVLLLPVHSGANGLNLIEATHILLVEPVLNQAQELQAIGRIHRIGQTKPTFVHRFIVKATIEEKMHSMLKSIQLPIDSHNDEESNLTIGDLWSLFSRRDVERQDGAGSDGAFEINGPEAVASPASGPSVPDNADQPPRTAEEIQQNLFFESDQLTRSEDIDERAIDTIPWVSEQVTV